MGNFEYCLFKDRTQYNFNIVKRLGRNILKGQQFFWGIKLQVICFIFLQFFEFFQIFFTEYLIIWSMKEEQKFLLKENKRVIVRLVNIIFFCCFLGGFCSCRCKFVNVFISVGSCIVYFSFGFGLQFFLECDSVQFVEVAFGALVVQEGFLALAGYRSRF